MKKKLTLTFNQEFCQFLSTLSNIMNKNQNEIIEEIFWQWWEDQDDTFKKNIEEMIKITEQVRKTDLFN